MSRAFLIVMDSVGCGGAPDAADFGDAGANTLRHIYNATLDRPQGPLQLPNLARLGLGQVMASDGGINPWGPGDHGSWAIATEASKGKDTPSGHWELTGVPVPWEWHYFPDEDPAFPPKILQKLTELCGGSLANTHASGMPVIEKLADIHRETGLPICYTSADSVFQIAAHEEWFGLEKLLRLCRDMVPMLHAMQVGRVIARPFVGDAQQGYTRTQNRKDFAIAPPSPTLCDWAQTDGRPVHAIGKIGDIFSMRGIDTLAKGDDRQLMSHLDHAVEAMPDGSLTFANFVEFDSLYGHRRDPLGYAGALEWFDAAIAPVLAKARAGDIFIFTADHGNDPTWQGSDHTRERVPVLVHGADLGKIGDIAMVDVAASVATYLGLSQIGPGRSFL